MMTVFEGAIYLAIAVGAFTALLSLLGAFGGKSFCGSEKTRLAITVKMNVNFRLLQEQVYADDLYDFGYFVDYWYVLIKRRN